MHIRLLGYDTIGMGKKKELKTFKLPELQNPVSLFSKKLLTEQSHFFCNRFKKITFDMVISQYLFFFNLFERHVTLGRNGCLGHKCIQKSHRYMALAAFDNF